MKLVLQTMLGIAVLAAVPAIAAIFHDGQSQVERDTKPMQDIAGKSIRVKDVTRLTNDDAGELEGASLPIKLAQNAHDSVWLPPPPFAFPPAGGFAPPFPAFAPPIPDGRPGPFGPFGIRPFFTRSECEENINREAALAGYLKSKLRLDVKQKEAWQRMEQAIDPVIEKLHQACDSLPVEASAPPSPPDAIDVVERQLSLRAELLQSLREPLRAFYDTLSPEQRNAIPPPPPFRHP